MGIVKMKAIKAAFFILLMFPFFIYAGDNADKTKDKTLPVLDNHYFMPSLSFPSPFMTTFFKVGIGSGASMTKIPVSLFEGKLSGTINAEDTFLAGSIDMQFGVKPWMAAWFSAETSARIGTSTPTILAHGFASVSLFEFGWLLRAFHNKKNLLSVSLSINNTTFSSTNILSYVKEVIETPDSIYVSISKERNPLSGVIGLRYAHTFNDVWGMLVFFSTAYGEAVVKNENNILKFDMGILGSVDFRKYNVPVGLNFGYSIRKFELFESQQEDNAAYAIFEVIYTHDDDYNMGLDISYVTMQTPLLDKINDFQFLSTTFILNYFF